MSYLGQSSNSGSPEGAGIYISFLVTIKGNTRVWTRPGLTGGHQAQRHCSSQLELEALKDFLRSFEERGNGKRYSFQSRHFRGPYMVR